jgi:hypothetical protein
VFRTRNRTAALMATAVTSGLLLAACGADGGVSAGSDHEPSPTQKEQKANGTGEGSVDFMNTPLPLVGTGPMELVHASVPEWNFSGGPDNDPCWPEDAFNPDGTPNDGADAPFWPDTDNGCAAKGAPHPTYFSVRQCTHESARVSFTIYMAHSGFKSAGGHAHDFEHIDVEWKFDGAEWTRDRLLLSQHDKHDIKPWAEAESWNADRGSAGLGREFPRIFVGFGSHAMYNNQLGRKDVASHTSTDLEYRGADYQSWADTNLVRVAPRDPNGLYEKFTEHRKALGDISDPARTHDTMCTHNEKGRGDGSEG